MSKCKICDDGVLALSDGELCGKCESNRFYDDDKKEIFYRKEVNVRVSMIEKLFGDDYNDTLHRNMVEQLIRCEIAMLHYENLISNNKEAADASELLRGERVHWRKLADQLHLTIKSIRGDTKNVKHDFPDDFKEYMKIMLESVIEDGDDEKDEDS